MQINGDQILAKALQEVMRLEEINIKQAVVIDQYEKEIADLKIENNKLQKQEVNSNESKSTNTANGQKS